MAQSYPLIESIVTYESGINAQGLLDPTSFWTWNSNTPATYGSTDYETKYGPPTAGTGATITYSFAAASNWTGTEEHAFQEGMALWSSIANVSFRQVTTGGDFTITRGTDGTAEAGATRLYPGVIGTAQLGTPTAASLHIDTSVGGFGPLGDSFNGYGGYPWMTLEHELGHILGLGHTGPYDDGTTTGVIQNGTNDSRALSIMSYNDPDSSYGWTITSVSGAREEGDPVTPQMADIAALQRIYGLPTDPTFAGGQVFGFHSNISGLAAPFFDFTQNTQPIVTLWDGGANNTLDVSGFTQNATINLNQGQTSSVGGLTQNVAIAYGAHIDGAVGGPGNDVLNGNTDGDTLSGGAGNDTINAGVDGSGYPPANPAANFIHGGDGDDLIHANYSGAGQVFGDAGNDTITGTSGTTLVFGNQGDDSLSWQDGSASLFGGQGSDTISYGSMQNAMVFGNLGDDHIGVAGSGVVYGGQGNDTIIVYGTLGVTLRGDLGDDTIVGATGPDLLIGGAGADVLTGGGGADRFGYAALSDSLPSAPDRITDFDPTRNTVVIDAIDAGRVAAGLAPFHWVASFDGGGGEAALSYDASSNTTTLMLDADGDRHADFAVVINGHLTEGGWLTF